MLCRFIRQGSIKLEGDEKALMAGQEAPAAGQGDSVEGTASTDFP
jgi:hypothetical protein